ncbi:UDP-N-acetylmuramate dehydrogenase [Butyricicoccus sp. 1XD8-22]|nr:UDP-N-acetylmuramate dehydrogenase [Butyricicoccus sp. 1XD8-22]
MTRIQTAVKPFLDTIEVLENELMSRHTTFRIGGPARYFIHLTPDTPLPELLDALHGTGERVTILGRGSNLLVRDEGIPGVVVCMLGRSRVCVEGTHVSAQSGATLAQIAAAALANGLAGAEFAAGIPGSVGGAVFMNAGAYDGSMSDIATESQYALPDGTVGTLHGAEHGFAYRESAYKLAPERVILSAELELRQGDPMKIRAKMDDLAARRRDKQPLEFPSAGSTFKRPSGYFAGKLIEDCGLKGFSVGGAQVSEKHAGFLINRGGATADDMRRLIEEVQARVLSAFGVVLECEVQFL